MKKQLKITEPKLLLAAASLVLACFSACKKDDKKAEPEPQPAPITPTDPAPVYGTVSDMEGNSYKTVVIGTQTWTAENLRSTKYNNGTDIMYLPNSTDWHSMAATPASTLYAQGAYCYYNNADSNKTKYGALYNWYAVNTGKLAPAGWHVADTADYRKLTAYITKTWGSSNVGGHLKSASSWWKSPNNGADNKTGFSALPGGFRDGNGDYQDAGYTAANFWLLNEANQGYSWYYRLANVYDYAYNYTVQKYCGLSVRCVKN